MHRLLVALVCLSLLGCGDENDRSSTTEPPGANPPASVTVPLQVVQLATDDRRLGVTVSIGGGPSTLLLFDTGSSGCFVAASRVGSAGPATGSFTIRYGSGLTYTGEVRTASVDFGSGAVASSAGIGAITQATPALPQPGDFDGTLGMSLVLGKPEQGGLYSIIAQMLGNLASGFVVSAGGSEAVLTIGLTDETRASFATEALPAQDPPSYPNGAHAWDDKETNLVVTLDTFSTTLRAVYDTGAVSTELVGANLRASLLANPSSPATSVIPGVTASFSLPGTPWVFTTGTTPNDDYIISLPLTGSGSPRVNSGIALFFRYDVLVDIERGMIGFRPAQ